MKTLLRSLYKLTQSAFERVGLYVVISRISHRNRPEVINRAIWKPFVVDDNWRILYKRTQAITQGVSYDNIYRQCKFYSTLQMANYAASLPVGDVIECGCWHGHSTVAIASILADHGFSGRFHVFDSFEGGLSDFKEKDESYFELSEDEKRAQIRQFESDFDFVNSVTEIFGFVELHRGWIPQSFASFSARPVKFVHVDVDMYEPTKAALEFFWDDLVLGGCIVVDDYNHAVFEGATRAVDEFLETRAPRIFYKVPFAGSCYIIK
jgi:O-methyltransferase